VTYGTTETFLLHFGLENIGDLPGLEELKAAGMFDGRLPQGFGMPTPKDDAALADDEDPLEGGGELFDDAPTAIEDAAPPEPGETVDNEPADDEPRPPEE
jgi:segregation and condensation protein B